MAGEKRGDISLRNMASHPFATVEIDLEQRLQDFLIQHDFRTLESIAVADLQGFGLSAEDAGKIHAACAASLLSAPPSFPPPVFAASALCPVFPPAAPALVSSTAAELLGYERRERRGDTSSAFPSSSRPSRSPSSASVHTESERKHPAGRKRERALEPPAQAKGDEDAPPQKDTSPEEGEEEKRPAQKRGEGQRRTKDRGGWREGKSKQSRDRKTHWSSGSRSLDHLLGGRGWREGMVTELFGAEGGATLTEVLVSCLVQALLECEHASVLFLSCRGFFPLSRLRALVAQNLRRRKALCSPASTPSLLASSSCSSSLSSASPAAAEAERDVLALLRRVHLAHCSSLDDLAFALRKKTREIERARMGDAHAFEDGKKGGENKKRRPNPSTGDPRESGSRRQEQQKAGGSEEGKVKDVQGRRVVPVPRAAEEDAATDDDSRPQDECLGGEGKDGGGRDDRPTHRLDADANDGESCRRKKEGGTDSKGRRESPCGSHLAVVAIDGLSLLLLPHAILDGTSVLQPVWRLLRQFAASSSTLVLTTNHTVATETLAGGHAAFSSNPSSLGLPPPLPPATMKRPGLGAVWSRCAPHQQLQIDLLSSIRLHAASPRLGNEERESSAEGGYLARVTVIKSQRQAAGFSTLIYLTAKGIHDPPFQV
uniref:Uncharacterized protein n=1 Tax=Neospora caninum (strain Liverpool) TaxID=572307 RepID=A0A0F7UND2_NEOCL|nr:TPA: hypothetical protein BN1204_056985 [Neospora caninum Liverpool]